MLTFIYIILLSCALTIKEVRKTSEMIKLEFNQSIRSRWSNSLHTSVWSKEEQQCSLSRPQTHVYVWKVVMGFGEGVLLGIVLLFSCGELCAATPSWFNTSNNETLNQIPTERPTTSSPQTTEQHANRTEQRHLVRSPVTYQLRSFQLRNPTLSRTTTVQPLGEQTQTFQSKELTPDQLESRESDPAQDVNSPVKQKSKVL